MSAPHEPHGAPVESEPDLAQSRPVMLILFGSIAIMAAFSVLAWWLLVAREDVERPSGRFTERELRPPELVNAIEQTLIEEIDVAAELDVRERARLESFGWVDRERGLVRIPIERAMELVIDEEGAEP